MKKIRTPLEGAGAALSARSTTTSNRTQQTPPEGALSGFSATTEQFIAASQSAATKRAYASDLKHFFANGGAMGCCRFSRHRPKLLKLPQTVSD